MEKYFLERNLGGVLVVSGENYMESKWVKEILALQREDGSWGYFHTLSNPTKAQPITTEQALRRLRILGLTEKDEAIGKAIAYIEGCLKGGLDIPDRREKFRDWKVFKSLMFATWLKLLSPGHSLAEPIIQAWAKIIEAAFATGVYDHQAYLTAYKAVFGLKPHNGRLVDFVSFYQVTLLQGALKPETERRLLKHLISLDTGIYYIYDYKIADLPVKFASKQTNRYLTALELLSGYKAAGELLGFATEWLQENRGHDGYWDLGSAAKDGKNFPLSDSWRSSVNRKKDCTARVERLLEGLKQKP